MKARDVLSADEIKSLCQPSDWQGARAVATTWSLIAAAFVGVALWPNPLTVVAALVILGSQQLGLAVLMHEASHRTLFANRRANDLVGQWVCGLPIWQDVHRYRTHHIKHHRFTGGEGDPDLSLVRPFPTSRGSLARKLVRDLLGISGVRRFIGLLLMDLGRIGYTVAGDRLPGGEASYGTLVGTVATNVLLFAVLAMLGHPWLYLLWAGAWMTTFGAVVRIRSIAEHACTDGRTRTTIARWWERLLFAPHGVNFHLEHHLLMTVPWFNLPRLHALLVERGALEGEHVTHGYAEVLRVATTKA